MKIICAWCKTLVQDGPADRVTHTICARCFAREMAALDA